MTSIIKKNTNIFPVLVILVAVAFNAARGQQPPIGGIDPGVLHLPRPDKIATPPFITAGTAIRQKYSDLASQNGVLGEATTDVLQCPDAVGYYVHYQGGSIYWTPDTGAHEIHGTIREKWAAMGWERSLLGYPLTDESTAPDGTGRYNQFQNGSIYWTPDTGAHEIHGAIREKWAAMGWERSYLQYPLSDEEGAPGMPGRISFFQGGSIAWTSSGGAVDSPLIKHLREHISTEDWAPVEGFVDVVLDTKGNSRSEIYMHYAGAGCFDYGVAAELATKSAYTFGPFSHAGQLHGTLCAGSRDDDSTQVGYGDQHIMDNWQQIRDTGQLFWKFKGQLKAPKELEDLVNLVIKAGEDYLKGH